MLLAWKTSITNPDPSFDPDDMVNMEDSFMKMFGGLKERKDHGGRTKRWFDGEHGGGSWLMVGLNNLKGLIQL